MELSGVRSIKALDLVPRTPRIGDRSKPRLGHSAGFCFGPKEKEGGIGGPAAVISIRRMPVGTRPPALFVGNNRLPPRHLLNR
jgi:hypothetical protein